ncbi:MAG TPA: chemotaxis protein CheB [Candidatus Handelsmanbacteria bacterium]|jgi:two-component system, chemotaxis family, protein-glutamate methylesterase/glutaminase|uniref:chemotaxis protein CheB n=1 Tax=Sulfitobacter TaxID=60136 RepID=UPI0017EE7AD2|nr:chemotaxis protein CheB [Candidatus Handelsmanbacteria bacterium]
MLEELSPWVIAIGASGAEGLDDLRSLLAEWQEINAIVMIVLHRPWEKDTHLRQILQRSTHMPVQIADQGQQLRPGCIYIGEPSRHLCLLSDSISILISDPKRAHRNRTVDLLFNSLVVLGGQRTIGIVLSGSLDDGSRGLAEIHDAGGYTMVLRREGQRRPGMPENARAYDGPVDVMGDVSAIAKAVKGLLTSAPRSS